MTYYDNHLEAELVARFNATRDLIPVTSKDAYVMKPNYTDHEGRLNWHYIHSENQERLQIKYWCVRIDIGQCLINKVLRSAAIHCWPRAFRLRYSRYS